MKKNFVVALIAAFALIGLAKSGYSAFDPDVDSESLIRSLEKSIAGQEKLLNSLRARYARLIAQKKQLSEWIEQEEQKLAQKQAGPGQPKDAKYLERSNILLEQKENLSKLDRELQVCLALEKKNKTRNTRDINYLSSLIQKQKELCASIIQLEENIAAEEKILKQLKESRKLPANY